MPWALSPTYQVTLEETLPRVAQGAGSQFQIGGRGIKPHPGEAARCSSYNRLPPGEGGFLITVLSAS